jgi:hypothetical protein
LLEWEWESLNPEDFSLDKDGNVFHNCGDKQSWSRVVRHKQNANNFFEKEKKYTLSGVSHKKVKSPRGSKFNSSYKGRIQLRKKKYKNQKYKNSRVRRIIVSDKKIVKRNKKRKDKKAFKQAVTSNEVSIIPTIESCEWCHKSSDRVNIFSCPREKYCCDFCEKSFDGLRLDGKMCGGCLHIVFRSNFCDDCEKNLGGWDINWRLKLEIPREHHPSRCNCEGCFQYRSHPCADCGMMSHTAQCCPWGTYSEEGDNQDDYEADYEGDEIQEAVRDDYLFGWDH